MPLTITQVDSETPVGGSAFTIEAVSVVIGGVTYMVVPDGVAGIKVFSVAATGQLTEVFSLAESGAVSLDRPYGVTTTEIGGQVYVYVAAYNEGLTTFTMAADGSLAQIANTPDPDAPADVVVLEVGGTTYLVSQGFTALTLYTVGIDGIPVYQSVVTDDASSEFWGYGDLEVVEVGGVSYIVARGYYEGISVFSISGGALSHEDSAALAATSSYGLGVATVGGSTYLIARDAVDGLVTYELEADGSLTSVGAVPLPGGAASTMIETFVDGGVTYVLAGVNGGIEVYSIDAAGALTWIQTVSTPGEAVVDLTVTTVGGQMILVAAGQLNTLSFTISAGGITGTAGPDTLVGTPGDDVMDGLGGNDVIKSLGGSDVVDGGDGDDTITGAAGDDQLSGGDGDDNIDGGAGDDLISGGAGTDVLKGSSGDDSYVIDDSLDTIVEAGSRGHDEVLASVDFTLPTNVEDLYLAGSAVVGTGNGSDNFIDGNGQDNVISGLAGDDELHGHGGDDQLDGGAGDDLIEGHEGDDEIWGGAGNDFLDPGDGDDIVHGGDGHDLMGDGLGESTLYGDAGDDEMHTATDGLEDWFYGGAGSDIIYSNDDEDMLAGGLGDDFYFVDGNGPTIIEAVGEGSDTVLSLDDYTLDDNVENLFLVGGPSHGIGNALANEMEGSSDNDILEGLGGNDTLYGHGRDRLIGGEGDDNYYLDRSGGFTPTVVEGVNGGTDTVRVNFDYRLLTNFENLTLYESAYEGIGNAVANILTGTDLDNRLVGLAGDDFLRGMGGADILEGGTGIDILWGGDGNDSLDGGVGDDILDGGSGLDTLSGSSGNDLYRNIDADDTIVEADSRGTDTVQALINYTLGTNLENLVLLGAATIGIGNLLANSLKGNASANLLQGMAGADELYGLDGDDTLVGGDGDDEMWGGDGDDEVSGDLGADVAHGQDGDDYISGGIGTDQLNGDNGDDELFGEDGNDSLRGGNDDDTLHGGIGNDTLNGGAGADRFVWNTADVGAKPYVDRITDLSFSSGDIIDLADIDANSLVAGDQAFSFVAAFTKVAGQAIVSYSASTRLTTVSFDINGDGKADFKIELNGDQRGTTGNLYTGGGDTDGGWLL